VASFAATAGSELHLLLRTQAGEGRAVGPATVPCRGVRIRVLPSRHQLLVQRTLSVNADRAASAVCRRAERVRTTDVAALYIRTGKPTLPKQRAARRHQKRGCRREKDEKETEEPRHDATS